MEKILLVNACIRPNSRTLQLASHVLQHFSGRVEEVKLYEENLSPLSLAEIEIREKADDTKDFSNGIFALAKQFAAADVIVIAAPYWDLMFPSVLKTYLENITVNGLTFTYGEKGIPKGLCQAKRLIYVTTSGGPIVCNFGYDYVAALAQMFYGIQEVKCVSAQGLDIKGADVTSLLDQAKGAIDSEMDAPRL